MSTTIQFQRKEILADPYQLVYEDVTGSFSLTNLTGYVTLSGDSPVADITARDALTPADGDVVDVTDASGDDAGYGTKRYYYDGSAWVLMDNVVRGEIAILAQALIHKTTGDVTVEAETYDPETVTELTFDYTEDGWYEIQVTGVRYSSLLNTNNTLEGIWPDGIANELVWDSGSNLLQYIVEALVETPPTIAYTLASLANSNAFSTTYSKNYSTSLEDFPYEYLCDCQRTALDRYMNERATYGLSESAKRYWDEYKDFARSKSGISFGISKNLYSEAQIISERTQLDCDCLTT